MHQRLVLCSIKRMQAALRTFTDRCAFSLQTAAWPRHDLPGLQARQSPQAVSRAVPTGGDNVGAHHALSAQAASRDGAPQLETAPEPLQQSQPELPSGQVAPSPSQQLAAATDAAAVGGALPSRQGSAGSPEPELPATAEAREAGSGVVLPSSAAGATAVSKAAAAEAGEAGSGVEPHSSAAGATADSEPAAGQLQLTVLAVRPLKPPGRRCA